MSQQIQHQIRNKSTFVEPLSWNLDHTEKKHQNVSIFPLSESEEKTFSLPWGYESVNKKPPKDLAK
jgi:hypothetical protein